MPLAQLLERLVDVDLLPLQRVDALGEFLARVHELRHRRRHGRVEIEDLADLGEREADAAAAQDQDDAGAVARRIDARLAAPLRRDQALVLIEAQRARGDAEFLGELADGVGAIGDGHFLPFAGLGVFAPLRPSL